MKKTLILAVGVGVSVFVVVVVITVVAVIVWCRVRRNRATLHYRSTLRPQSTVITLDSRIVEARLDYRLSRDPFASRGGDQQNDSLKELKVDLSVQNGGPLAYPPPVNVPPPPQPNA